MIIIDEKMALPPPPPYVAPGPVSPPPFPSSAPRIPASLNTVPPHILLKIVYETFTRTASIEKQRQTLYWLNISLRFVSRAIYVACMHVLRSTYLPAYTTLIRQPYTSDPFPLTSTTAITPLDPSISPVQSFQRETKTLDLFIALKVREDVWLDDSELHLERDESFRDIFDLMQPRSRMEDLVRVYGVREGIVTVPGAGASVKRQVPSSSSSAGTSSSFAANRPPGLSARSKALAVLQRSGTTTYPIPFSALSVNFSSRRAGLVLTTRERKKTIVEVERTRDEKLEAGAKNLVKVLKGWMASNWQ